VEENEEKPLHAKAISVVQREQSVVVGQVKYKVTGDKKGEAAICPNGAPRYRQQPLPRLAILTELVNESRYKENNSKIKYTTSEPPAEGEFENLINVGMWLCSN